MSGTWIQASMKKNMAAFTGRYVRDIPSTSSRTATRYFIYRATTKSSWAFKHTQTVKMMHIDHHSHIARWLTMMKGQQSSMLHWRTFSRWGRESFTFPWACKGCQYFGYDYLQPVTPQITHDIQPTMINAALTLMVRMGQGDYRNLSRL
jgi:hypothetical protein